jgi:FtsP/CotA-like multicopper oxidase with cupredoxin domain
MVRIGLMASRIFTIDRRHLLAGMGAAAVGGALSPAIAAGAMQPLALRARPGSVALRPGQAETPVSLLEAPAPALRFKRGDGLEIALQNDLAVPAVINWRGLAGSPSADPLTGQAALKAGGRTTFSATLRDAGTQFADLRLLETGGAPPSRALPLVVEEDGPRLADQDEIMLIEDFRLRQDGTAASVGADAKDTAAVYTVNGLYLPEIAVRSNARVRLRFINACQRNVIAVKIEGLDAAVLALDGQPSEPFPARNGATVLAPGGRADVFFDMLRPSGSSPPLLLHDGAQAQVIARLRIGAEIVRQNPFWPAGKLPSNGLPAQLDLKNAQRAELVLQGPEWIAPASFTTTSPPAFRVKPGRIVVLALTNRANLATVFHLHGHHFRLLDRLDDGWKPYWLDTLAIEPGQTQRIAFAAEYAGRWLLECTATDWAAPRLVRWYAVE